MLLLLLLLRSDLITSKLHQIMVGIRTINSTVMENFELATGGSSTLLLS